MSNEKKVCTIEQLGTIGRGRSKHRPRNDSVLFGGEYPFIQTGDVKKANLYITDYEETYNEIGLAQSKIWDEGTLCITIAANIAETAILGIKACFPDSVVGFVPFQNISDTKYVKYMMDMFKVYMQQISKGTTQDNLSLDKIKRVKFEVPDYSEQIKIANFLSSYDDLIENNTKRIKLLEQMAENLYKEWFVRFRFPGSEKVEFVDGLPIGWKRDKLRSIASEIGCHEKKENRNRYDYYIPIDCISSHSMALVNEDSIENAESSLVKFSKGNILFGAMRPYFHKVVMAPFDGLTRTTCFVIKANNDLYSDFLYLLLFQKTTVDFATTVSVGSTMPYVRWEDFNRLSVIIPTTEIVSEFSNIVKPIIKQIEELVLVNKNLIKQRDLLLPRLMSGRLKVT